MVYVARFVYGYVDDYGDEILEQGRDIDGREIQSKKIYT